MSVKDVKIAESVLEKIGGKDNISQATHCMTRLRFNLKDDNIANEDEIKKIDGVLGCKRKGGQLQVIIGTNVSTVYDELCKISGIVQEKSIDENLDKNLPRKKKSGKDYVNAIFDYLAGSLTPLIPVLIAASFFKTLVAVLGPSLLGIISETSNLYILFSFAGDAGFYFLPIFIAYTAAKKLNSNTAIAMMLGGIMIHPTFLGLAQENALFTVFGIPSKTLNYTGTIIPMLLTVWVMSHVEKIFKKYTPEVIKVFLVPFGTALIMLPLSLCLLGPLGSILGDYVCNGIIGVYNLVGPLGVGLIGATFAILVLTGMHMVLFTYLFITFPTLGYDSMLLPGILCASWASTGVALACIYKFKEKKKKSLTFGYVLTWFFGGVGEPMLYGLSIPYKTPLYAGVISGFISGIVAGFTKLSAYTLNTSNGVYALTAFIGGPKSNYIALVITLLVCLVSGFAVMMFMKLDESKVN